MSHGSPNLSSPSPGFLSQSAPQPSMVSAPLSPVQSEVMSGRGSQGSREEGLLAVMAAGELQAEVLRTRWLPQLVEERTNQMGERIKIYRKTNLACQDPATQPSFDHDSRQGFECTLIEEGGLDTCQCSTGLREHHQNSMFLPRTQRATTLTMPSLAAQPWLEQEPASSRFLEESSAYYT